MNYIGRHAREDKVRAAIIGGAIGDALGAPLEGERNFKILDKKFGYQGVQEFVHPVSPNDNKVGYGFRPGDTTDDTACVVGVAAALELSRHKAPGETIRNLWQAQIAWGAYQRGDKEIPELTKQIAGFVDDSLIWPDWYTPFYNNIGAGKGTLRALATGLIGTPETPISQNAGCGGMMRVAPIALLPLEEYEIVDLTMRSTALTHGAPEAQAAAVAAALTIRNAFNGISIDKCAEKTIETMMDYKLQGAFLCREAFMAARDARASQPAIPDTVDKLPRHLGYTDHFMAIPVLSQIFYGTMLADIMRRQTPAHYDAFLQTVGRAVTISGDSDSTGAILGNILGAAWGTKALPPQLWNRLSNRSSLEYAALSLNQTIEEMQYEPA